MALAFNRGVPLFSCDRSEGVFYLYIREGETVNGSVEKARGGEPEIGGVHSAMKCARIYRAAFAIDFRDVIANPRSSR